MEEERHRVGLLLGVLLVLRVRVRVTEVQVVALAVEDRHRVPEVVMLPVAEGHLLEEVVTELVTLTVEHRVRVALAAGEEDTLGLKERDTVPEVEPDVVPVPAALPPAIVPLAHTLTVRLLLPVPERV